VVLTYRVDFINAYRILRPMTKLTDIADIYRRHHNPRRPFSYFFNSRGYATAHAYLKSIDLPDEEIMIREMPSRGHPSVALVHPIIAIEFIRWLDYSKFVKLIDDQLSK
jgi:hypothetical protein